MLSRVADSLYWMSRFLERAEHTARAIDVQLQVALDEAPASASMGWVCLLNSLRTELPAELCSDDRAISSALLFDRANPSSVISCVELARENARQIREQITSDVWEEINRLYLSVREMDIDGVWREGPHGFLRRIQRGAQLLAGVRTRRARHRRRPQFRLTTCRHPMMVRPHHRARRPTATRRRQPNPTRRRSRWSRSASGR